MPASITNQKELPLGINFVLCTESLGPKTSPSKTCSELLVAVQTESGVRKSDLKASIYPKKDTNVCSVHSTTSQYQVFVSYACCLISCPSFFGHSYKATLPI